jgi:hypothetical protein
VSSSKFQDLRAALKTAVVAQLATDTVDDVDVFEYAPVGNATREDQVWFGRITVDQENLTMGGTGRVVGETISVDVSVRAPRVGSDQQDMSLAEQRAETIWGSVESAVRSNATLLASIMDVQIDSFESIPDYDEQGAIGVIEASIVGMSNI